MNTETLSDRRHEQWHLSKSIPISLIIVIVIQAIAVVWWNAKLESKVDSNSVAIITSNMNMAKHWGDTSKHMPYGEKIEVFMTRVEADSKFDNVDDSLKEIKDDLKVLIRAAKD